MPTHFEVNRKKPQFEQPAVYRFGDFEIIVAEDLLLRSGVKVALNRRAFNVLRLMIERRGQIVSKQEFFDTVWCDTFVEDNSLTVAITTLRKVLGEDGKPFTVTMGCYGIGVTRVVAAAIEQNYDDKGIIWPQAIAPFEVAIVPMNAHKSPRTLEAAEALYAELQAQGYDVLLDDRNERPGVKFSDLELMGIPHRIVIGEKGLDAGTFEYKGRRDTEASNLSKDELLAKLAG